MPLRQSEINKRETKFHAQREQRMQHKSRRQLMAEEYANKQFKPQHTRTYLKIAHCCRSDINVE